MSCLHYRSLFLLASLTATAWWISGVSGQEKPETSAEETEAASEKSEPKTLTVKLKPFKIETELEGVFESLKMMPVSLRPEEYSTLEVVEAVEHGATVKKGERLVWFETKTLDEQIRETQLAVELGELSMKEAEEDLKYLNAMQPLELASAERSHMIAHRHLEQYKETDQPFDIRSAKQSLKSSAGQLENAQEELRQLEKMYKADDLTEETEEIILKRARRSVESAELFYEMAKIRADRRLSESIPERMTTLIEEAKRADSNLARTKATSPIEKRQAEIALEKLERSQKKLVEKLDRLEADRKLLEVTAPSAGVVYYGACTDGTWTGIDTVAKQLKPGKTLSTNQVFMTIVQLRPMQIRMSIAEKDLKNIKMGLSGSAKPTFDPDQSLPIKISSVATIPSGSNKFTALASVKAPEQSAIVPGMTCKVNITAYENKNAIVIPEKATIEEDGKAYVLVQGDGDAKKRSVKLGRSHDGNVEVLEGLEAGEKILAAPKAE